MIGWITSYEILQRITNDGCNIFEFGIFNIVCQSFGW